MSVANHAVDLEAVIAELKARIEKRRDASEYPDDIEATLDEHFDRPWVPRRGG